MEPFRVFGNLYFVGTEPASAHLIDTGAGLILLDSGYPETLYLVLDSIRRLGFRLEDLALILHSHGHIDHIGGTRALVELTGAKTAIGAADADTVRGRRPLTFAKELGMTFDGFFRAGPAAAGRRCDRARQHPHHLPAHPRAYGGHHVLFL